MNFSTSFLRPGTIVEVSDNYGTVRATSPGLFSVDDDPSLLPPIYPFVQVTSGQFSSPLEGDKIWIFHDDTNTQLFMYLKLNQLPQSVKDILDLGDANQEIVFSRDTNKGLYQIFFNDGTGIKLMHDDNYICIDPNGNIDMVTENNNRSISISGDSVCLGKSSEEAGSVSNHVAYGEKVEECLEAINNILTQLQVYAAVNPYTSTLSPAFASLPQLGPKIHSITSKDVKTV